jgi:mevalonate kinase
LKATAKAPGKAILTGEHFVVYGQPALVVAIDRFVSVTATKRPDTSIRISSTLGYAGTFEDAKFRSEQGGDAAHHILTPVHLSARAVLDTLDRRSGLDVTVDSEIPVEVGLGSSGALAVATVSAVGRLFDVTFSGPEVVTLSLAAERYVHNNPSGVDQTVSTYGGVVHYRKSQSTVRLEVESPLSLVIGNTGVRRETGRLVDRVRARRTRIPDVMDPVIRSAGVLTAKAVEALQTGNIPLLGELMDVNHGLLVAAGVSSIELEHLVHAARRGGAWGAKLTGAGGGGCVLALAPDERLSAVSQAIRSADGEPIQAKTTDEGVHSWIDQ